MDEGIQNEIAAKELINQLVLQGVDYFCCAPGSRSTPLAIAVAAHPEAQCFVHFDERGLAFHAVGYAKATRRPAVIIVTSGTAVANLLPAVVEAHNERVPLILLTSDRPSELQSCGANQTCDQVRMFSNFVRWQMELPCPSPILPTGYLATTIAQAVLSATHLDPGPVHLNCPFREPLFSKTPTPIPSSRTCEITTSILSPSSETIEMWSERFSQVEHGIILCGSDHLPYAESVFKLAEQLQWPIFADILSPLRTRGTHPHLITHFDPLLKTQEKIACDAVLQFGNRFTSKALAQWLERQTLQFYLHVSDHTMRQDPSHHITHRLHTTPHLFCDQITCEHSKTALPLQTWNETCQEHFHQYFDTMQEISEPGIFHELSLLMNEEWALFLANSMPIRDANQFFAPRLPCGPIFANRGVSGIDGNIATAVGIAQGLQKPTLAVMGDMTFLHDLNSLAQVANTSHPVILLVINNSGGGIFSFLPVSKRKDVFEKMILAPHSITFHHAAQLFGISYHHPDSSQELKEILENRMREKQSCIIEVTTERDDNVALHAHITQEIGSISLIINNEK